MRWVEKKFYEDAVKITPTWIENSSNIQLIALKLESFLAASRLGNIIKYDVGNTNM